MIPQSRPDEHGDHGPKRTTEPWNESNHGHPSDRGPSPTVPGVRPGRRAVTHVEDRHPGPGRRWLRLVEAGSVEVWITQTLAVGTGNQGPPRASNMQINICHRKHHQKSLGGALRPGWPARGRTGTGLPETPPPTPPGMNRMDLRGVEPNGRSAVTGRAGASACAACVASSRRCSRPEVGRSAKAPRRKRCCNPNGGGG